MIAPGAPAGPAVPASRGVAGADRAPSVPARLPDAGHLVSRRRAGPRSPEEGAPAGEGLRRRCRCRARPAGRGTGGRGGRRAQCPRAIHSSRCGASAPMVVGSPWPVRTTVSGGRREQPVPDRVDDRREVRVGPAGRARAALEEGVAGEDGAEARARRGRPRPARGPGCAGRCRSAPAASMHLPVGELGVRAAGRGGSASTAAGRRGAAGSARRCARRARGGVDVVVVGVGAHDRAQPPVADRLGDGVGVVRGVDDDRLVVVADDPDVVVDVPGAAVEGERARR